MGIWNCSERFFIAALYAIALILINYNRLRLDQTPMWKNIFHFDKFFHWTILECLPMPVILVLSHLWRIWRKYATTKTERIQNRSCFSLKHLTLVKLNIYLFYRASEIGRTGSASHNFVNLFERQSSIDSQSSSGLKPV